MKQCFKCGEAKPLSAFYKHPQMGDGHLNKCKECAKADVAANYYRRHSQYREYDSRRDRSASRRQVRIESGRRHASVHPDRYKARYALHNAIVSGLIVRRPCEVCGDPKSEGHHEDYSKPLEVRWLCFKHHREAHGQIVAS